MKSYRDLIVLAENGVLWLTSQRRLIALVIVFGILVFSEPLIFQVEGQGLVIEGSGPGTSNAPPDKEVRDLDPIVDEGDDVTDEYYDKDTDQDGMADAWENLHFGNLARGSTGESSSDLDQDGYTDLEEFLNSTDPKNGQRARPKAQ